MIARAPDTALTPDGLAREIERFCREVEVSREWRYREKYVDRGRVRDPFYILDFMPAGLKPDKEDLDDLLAEPLYQTRLPGLKVKHITRQGKAGNTDYWHPISDVGLVARLERFLTMYREDTLQPPGVRDELEGGRRPHERFQGKRFIFRLQSPARCIVAIGPSSQARNGAIRGFAASEGVPLAGVDVELVPRDSGADSKTKTVVIRRRTDNQGRFWISRAPAGKHVLRVRGHEIAIDVTVERFGCLHGQLKRPDGGPISGARIALTAPDGEVFTAVTNSAGNASTGPIPGFPYIARVPDFLFMATVSFGAGSSISGTLVTESGQALANATVILKQSGENPTGEELARQTSDSRGRFSFSGLKAGRYTVSVAGHRIHSTVKRGGDIRGRVSGAAGPVELHLVARGQVVATTRTRSDGSFAFSAQAPGDYAIRSEGLLLCEEKQR